MALLTLLLSSHRNRCRGADCHVCAGCVLCFAQVHVQSSPGRDSRCRHRRPQHTRYLSAYRSFSDMLHAPVLVSGLPATDVLLFSSTIARTVHKQRWNIA